MKIVINIKDDDYYDIIGDALIGEFTTREVINAVKDGTPLSPEWIPINNKRPQDGQHIFISTVTGKIHDIVWNSECIHNFARNGCWYKNWFVIAWTPFFIEPYTSESEEENEKMDS